MTEDCEQAAYDLGFDEGIALAKEEYDLGFDEGSELAKEAPLRWHPSIVAMADAMQEKLDKNTHKKGWLSPDCDVEFLIRKLNEETKELRYAVRKDNMHMVTRINDVRLEAADVANIAMMIADNMGAYDEDILK